MPTYQRMTKGSRITTLMATDLIIEKTISDIPKDWYNKELGNSEILSIQITDSDGKQHSFSFRDEEIAQFKDKLNEACL